MNDKRLDFIDVAKGLGIILVVIGHTKFRYIDLIYVFHMPLFFIISGFLFNHSKWLDTVKEFYINRYKRLILPYWRCCAFFYMFWVFIGRHWGESIEKNVYITKPLLGIFYANGTNDWLIFNTPLWYLPCLFVTELIFINLLIMFNNKPGQLIVGVLFTTFLGYFISKVLFLPWGMDIALVSQGFMFLGYQLRCKNIFYEITKIQAILFITIFSIILIIVDYVNGRIDMNSRIYNNFLLFYLGGISGSVLILFLSQVIMKFQTVKRLLITCGKKTLIILVFHVMAFKMVSALVVFLLHLPLKLAQQELWFLYSLVGIMIPLCMGIFGKNNFIIKKLFYQNSTFTKPKLPSV